MAERTIADWLESPSATIKPEPVGLERFVSVAESLREGPRPPELGDTLGVGGAGIVRTAVQPSLGRTVAAKQLIRPTPEEERQLLQEAWVLGHLEHPHIVPIHDVAVDEEGRLTLLLKRIDGEEWSRWIGDPSGVAETFATDDVLGWHLSVLTRVCQAIAFAHDRGVLHRDLKPENVMIGAFGEVAVLDWGIAAGLGPGAPAPAPRPGQIAGTPRYMAPEMWDRPETVDARTDVFLLGGLLHAVLAGRPPMDDQHRFTPAWPPGTPHELAQIAERALSPDPADRHPSASDLRTAIEGYLAHRGSLALTDAAESAARGETEESWREARFGFAAALRQWPDNHRAEAGLAALSRHVARIRLDQGDALGAQRIADDLPPGDPLHDAIAAAVNAHTRHQALGEQLDPTVGAADRSRAIAYMAVAWMTIPIWGHFVSRGRPPGREVVYGGSLALLVFTLGVIALIYRHAEPSPLTRRLAGWCVLTPVLQMLLSIGLDLWGVPVPAILGSHFFLWGTTVGTAALAVDRRVWLPAVLYYVAFLLTPSFPDGRYLLMAVPNAALAIAVWQIYFGASES